jgi:protein SCO1/2
MKDHPRPDKNEDPSAPTKTSFFNRPLVYFGLAAVLVTAVLAGRQFLGQLGGPVEDQTLVEVAPVLGGPFTLVDRNGKTVTDDDFRGRFLLINFGYTYCPDICPTILSTVTNALDKLADKGEKVVPVFITIDPERDTPEQLKMYISHFHPRMLGLTGTLKQVKQAARVYRVYYAKFVAEGADPDDYLMDHTAITYLVGPEGKYRFHFGPTTTAEEMASRLREVL